MNINAKSKWASAIIGLDQYKTDLILDNHTLIADEPVDIGGKDLGPSPGDLITLVSFLHSYYFANVCKQKRF
jgi:hypothetical protein